MNTNNVLISDYFPALFSPYSKLQMNTQSTNYVNRVFNAINMQRFVKCVSQEGWDGVYGSSCSNQTYDIFYGKFNSLFQQNFPLTRIKVSYKAVHDYWFDPLH